jgi:hypothetical protein
MVVFDWTIIASTEDWRYNIIPERAYSHERVFWVVVLEIVQARPHTRVRFWLQSGVVDRLDSSSEPGYFRSVAGGLEFSQAGGIVLISLLVGFGRGSSYRLGWLMVSGFDFPRLMNDTVGSRQAIGGGRGEGDCCELETYQGM